MIQFLKGYTWNGRKFPIGQKVTLIPQKEQELIEENIAVSCTWNGKTEKVKTEFFKPKK